MLLGLKGNFVSRITTFLLLLIVVVSGFLVRNDSLAAVSPQTDELQPGDILFVDLYKGWCHSGYWDHMALYIGEQSYEGRYYVVEVTYDGGVCHTPVEIFFGRDKPAEISARRLKEMPFREEKIQHAIDYALAQVGKPFDRIAVPGLLPLKTTEEKHHCAEVVWRAYEAAGIDLDSDDGVLLSPDDIYYSPWLNPA